MLTKFLLSITLLLSLNTQAQDTVEVANALYAKRAADYKNAQAAATLYSTLATTETETLTKAKLFTQASQAIFYYGDQNLEGSKKELLKIFKSGMAAATNAIDLLSDEKGLTSNEDYKTPLAYAYYYFSACLGKWGETKGVLASLGKWKSTLRPTLKKILKLDPTVEQWGANRILARAFQKVPYESNAKGLEYIEEAFEETYNEDLGLASNMTTNEYYLYLSADQKDWDAFCEVYEAIVEIKEDVDAQSELNPEMLPETQNTLADILGSKSFKKSFNKKCL